MKVIAGVDCHKETHAIAFLDAVGSVLHEISVPASAAGYQRAIEEARALSNDVVWGLESTGCYGYQFASQLLASGATVYEVPGSFTKRHRKHSSRRGKSDVNDARAIAEAVLRESDRLPQFRDSDEQRALRLRYDQRDRLVRMRTDHTNRLHAAILQVGLGPFPSDLGAKNALSLLRSDAENKRDGTFTKDALVDDILFTIDAIEHLNTQIVKIEGALRPFVKVLAPELLAIYGIGAVGAAGLVGHAGNAVTYRDHSAFAMRCGTAPVSCSSGRSQAVRVNTGGNRQLNRILHTAAIAQVRRSDHPGRAYYLRKRSEGRSHAEAMRCLKRQITKAIFKPVVVALSRTEHTRVTALAV